jgi:mannosyltransferase OCH1-like enzyme
VRDGGYFHHSREKPVDIIAQNLIVKICEITVFSVKAHKTLQVWGVQGKKQKILSSAGFGKVWLDQERLLRIWGRNVVSVRIVGWDK